jgi:tetraacyldisaccharide 4'-kinase
VSARALESWLNDVWYSGRPGAGWLWPLAQLFAAGAAVRRWSYRVGLSRSYRAPVPVIVIGNVTVGGAGKTPLTSWLARELVRRGRRVGVLSRGYRGTTHGVHGIEPSDDAGVHGDEAVLLARDLAGAGVKVVVAADRPAGARRLAADGVEIILCDDGLQHYALQRSLEVAVVDAQRGLGNRRLLPAGPLREPAERLSSVDWVVVNVGSAADVSRAFAPIPGVPRRVSSGPRTLAMRVRAGAVRSLAATEADRALRDFAGARVHAVAGMADPSRFFAMLRMAGLDCIEHRFPDHHPFRAADLQLDPALPILMTSKDAVKCGAFATPQMWEVTVESELQPPERAAALLECIVTRVEGGA